MDKIVVAVAEKQTLFQIGICHSLSTQLDIEVQECAPHEDLMQLIETYSPNILLLDMNHPPMKGLNLARNISLHYPMTKIIMLTFNLDDEQLFEVIKAGAAAYLDKSVTAEELIRTIRQVSSGKYPINDSVLSRPRVAKQVLTQFQAMSNGREKPLDGIVTSLTSRETEILNYIADGNSNKQIASILQISEQTAKNHVSNILRKLNANDRAHAVVLAIRHGWISAEELTLPEMTVNRN
jgi:two-component system response regulator DegU